MNNIADPYRFTRAEVQSQADQIMLDRLALRINEFKDLADIPDWRSIQKDRDIYLRLQEAHNIMHDMKWFDDSGRFRCKPCEMEGLCAIKTIVKGDNFRREHNKQVLEYMDFKPLDPDIMKKNIEEYYKDEG